MLDFAEITIHSWEDFLNLRHKFGDEWVFRGQSSDWPLSTSLERACKDSDIKLKNALRIEKKIIREFRRQYDGSDRDIVTTDTLYCLALMQHHGAPTRLLDWTYSRYVAIYFALEALKPADQPSVVWCLKQTWCLKQARAIAGETLISKRDELRNEETFRKLYTAAPPYKLVFLENPFFLHRKLIIQQGVFLCSGDISVPFEDNLKSLDGWHKASSVVKIRCEMTTKDRLDALEELHRMNVHRANLFPGLDGFAQSLNYRLRFYEQLATNGEGTVQII